METKQIKENMKAGAELMARAVTTLKEACQDLDQSNKNLQRQLDKFRTE